MYKTYLTSWLLALLIISCTSDPVEIMEEEMMEEEEEMQNFDPTADWMQQLLADFPDSDFKLFDICLPRSHDAGTYLLQNCSVGANACNTQTQHQNTYNQLMDGIRNFDVRPKLMNGVYFTHHTTGCDGLGCNGDRVDNVLNQLKDFLDEHAELVIIEFGHWCNTNGNDVEFQAMVSSILGERLYKQTGPIGDPFIQRPLASIIPPGTETGLAVMIYDGVSNTEENRSSGVFTSAFIPRTGTYANAQDVETMREDQFGKYAGYNNDGSKLFEFSWTLTMDTELAVACAFPWTGPKSIRDMADEANTVLTDGMDQLIAIEQIRKGRIPNVISVDFCEPFVTEECLRISRLNLE